MRNKKCNQFFVKDDFRDKKFAGTIKCSCCNEESNLNAKFPFTMDLMINFINAFVTLHKKKGCNKSECEVPDWASGEINFGVAMGFDGI